MRIIRILPGVYNEEDILEENLLYYINQGIDTVVIDNKSTDRSYEISKKYLGKGIVGLSEYSSSGFDTMGLLKLATYQLSAINPDWVIMADADEFIEPPRRYKDLTEAINSEDKRGYNLIRQYNIIFKMTGKDPKNQKSILKRMKHYVRGDLDRSKIWKHNPYVIIRHPHQPEFLWKEDIRLSPVIYVSRHYPLRSLSQAQAKIKRVKPCEEAPIDWNIHYIKYKESITRAKLCEKYTNLTKCTENGRWNVSKITKECEVSYSEIAKHLLQNYNSYIIEKKIKLYPNWQNKDELIILLIDSYIKDKRYDEAIKECQLHLKRTKKIEKLIKNKLHEINKIC